MSQNPNPEEFVEQKKNLTNGKQIIRTRFPLHLYDLILLDSYLKYLIK